MLGNNLPADKLLFLPLGGAGEIGMNLNLYGWGGKWLMVDCGITFADEDLPGIDVLVPDPAWIADRRKDLLALVVTHAHEDHLGAIPYLWEDLRCPVYATPFAAAVLRRKLEEWHLGTEVPVHIFQPGDTLDIGPFKVTAVPMTHSIPEMQALAIDTPVGMVLHSGDWKLDPDPLVGPVTNEPVLRELGAKGVLALVCDSTNVFNEGESGSEAAVRTGLLDLCRDRPGRIAITTFASNIARMVTVAHVARETGRSLCLIGRSLLRMSETARELGYLAGLPDFLTEYDVGYLPKEKVMLLCTGCQGEPRGAMARIASDTHPHVKLGKGDTVIFSSRIIPGNERAIGAMQNRMVQDAIEVITERDALVHVSGHPARDELARLYAMVRPRISIPVHGEARHIHEHARYAKSLQVPMSATLRNGQMLAIDAHGAKILGEVPAGRLAVDWGNGDLMLPDGPVLQARRRLMLNGIVMVSLVLAEEGFSAATPRVTLSGVAEGEADELAEEIQEAVEKAIGDFDMKKADEDAPLAEAVRRAVRRVTKDYCGRRPPVEVHILRLGGPRRSRKNGKGGKG